MVLEEGRSEPWSRKLPQSDAGGARRSAQGQREIHQEYIENREQEESRKSIEDEKVKVEREKKVSEAALKRLERDRKETGAAQRELEE